MKLDLDIAKPRSETRVVVAMSGGVDSSVTAAMVKAAGYDTVGITLQLYDHGAAVERKGACCAGQDILDAQRVAERIGVPHYVLDYESRFRDAVIDDFADSYLRGETPVPCIRCNQTVKFRDLLQTARDLGADALATGHYVRRVAGATGAELRAAVDDSRDQSYFLFATTAEQLGFLRFPLGDLPKSEVRALAEQFDLPVAAKPDSQDICFVPNGNYADVVRKLRPSGAAKGEIVHLDGRVLGSHDGIVGFTVGQRRGIGVGGVDGEASEPLYVVRLEPQTRRVVVGPKAALARDIVHLGEINWLGDGDRPQATGLPVTVKLRSTRPPEPAVLHASQTGPAFVELNEPQHGISPGQACVLYANDASGRVLGGAWIVGTSVAKTELAAATV